MQIFQNVSKQGLWGCLLAVLATFVVANPCLAAPVAGYVKDIKGQIVAVQAGEKRSLAEMSPVFVADEIESDASGGAQLRMVDESSVFLGPGSKLVVADMGFVEVDGKVSQHVSMNVKAVSGAFRFVTGKVAKANPDNFKVETPMGLIGVRGTDFSSLVRQGFERHRLNSGGPLFVQDLLGNRQGISQSGFGVVLTPGMPIGQPAPMSPQMLSFGGGQVSLAQLTGGPGGFGGATGPNGPGGPIPTTPTTDQPGNLAVNQSLSLIARGRQLSRLSNMLAAFYANAGVSATEASGPEMATRWYLGSAMLAESGFRKVAIATNQPYVLSQFFAEDSEDTSFLRAQTNLPGHGGRNLADFYGLSLGLRSNGLTYTGIGVNSTLSGAGLNSAGQLYYQALVSSLRQAGLDGQANYYEGVAATFNPTGFAGLSGMWVYGVPTVSDLPTAGTATYQGAVAGRWSNQDSVGSVIAAGIFGGTSSASVDFARDRITDFTVNLTGCPLVTRLGGSGTITRNMNARIMEYGLIGNLDAAHTLTGLGVLDSEQGDFSGRFHGPGGQEMGGEFGWKGRYAGTNHFFVNGVFGAGR